MSILASTDTKSERLQRTQEAYYFLRSLPVINDPHYEGASLQQYTLALFDQLRKQAGPVVVAYIEPGTAGTFDQVCEIDYCGEILTKHRVTIIGFIDTRHARFDNTALPRVYVANTVSKEHYQSLELEAWESHLLQHHQLSDEAAAVVDKLLSLRRAFRHPASLVTD